MNESVTHMMLDECLLLDPPTALRSTVDAILEAYGARRQKDKGTNAVALPLIVGLAGVPGSGKTTLAEILASGIMAASEAAGSPLQVVVVPMDGYHKYRSELSAMPNAEEAFVKRGIHWTFSPDKLAADLRSLRETGEWSAPTFDHAVKDPVEGGVVVTTGTHIVIVEGLYMAFRGGLAKWEAVQAALDVVIFLEIDLEVSTERLTKRHMSAWGISREEAYKRAAGSDLDNAKAIVLDVTAHPPDIMLRSASIELHTSL